MLPNIQREDSQTEERIAHILNEAQMAMQNKKSVEQAWTKEVENNLSVVTPIIKSTLNGSLCCIRGNFG